ncbi:MAG: hypothetical protein PHG05_03790 [Candidatus Nanoarchaeia archaeon]|nr:hypothetical protein [Candidatus Nanoarchaeia archaeon]
MDLKILDMLKVRHWKYRRDISQPAGWKYRVEGLVDIEGMYKDLWKFFSDKSYDIEERDNTTKKKDRGDDVEFKFYCQKEVDDYVRYHTELKFYITNAVKVKHEEKTYTKCKFEVNATAYLKLDYQNKWKRTKIGNKLHNFYQWYLIKWRIDKYYETGLFIEFEQLKDIIKRNAGLFY